MVWGNNSHEFAEASMGYPSNLTGASYKARGFENPGLISYMESHDEERNVYKNKQWGNSKGNYSTKNPVTSIERAGLAAIFNLMIPGPKMIWMFGELGYDYSINTCEDGSISDDCRLSPKPIRWDYLDHPTRMDLFDLYAFMNNLRQENEVFETTDYDLSVTGYQKKVKLMSEEQDMILVGNFDLETQSNSPGFTKSGIWYELFTEDSLMVNDINMSISLEPGGYRLYATEKWATSTSNIVENVFDYNIFPNPTSDKLYFQSSTPMTWSIYDMYGKLNLTGDCYQDCEVSVTNLIPGLYLVQLENETGQRQSTKIIKY